MLHEHTKSHILGLNDSDLLEYVLTGFRMYEREAVEFAREELDRRALPEEQTAAVRLSIIQKLARYDAETPPDPHRAAAVAAVVCQACGLEAPTKYVGYYQNTGALFVRFTDSYRGHFCRRCNHRRFWKATLGSAVCGWWGVTSFFITIGCLVNNVIVFLRSLSLPRVPPDAAKPQYDESVIERVAPHNHLITDRLTQGMDPADIAREIAPLAGVTPGQAWCLVTVMRQQLAAPREPLRQPPIFAFPVISPHPTSQFKPDEAADGE